MAMANDSAGSRRGELLDAAARVFLRYGYRKTSMDEVARAADLSRPGLYLHFPTKELLFREAVAHLLDRALTAARQALADVKRPLDDRIVDGFAAVHGHTIGSGVSAQHMAELIDSTNALASDTVADHERSFRDALIRTLEPNAGTTRAITAPELADLLTVISVGLKHRTDSLAEYRERMRAAVRLLCDTGEHRRSKSKQTARSA
jgi:AcrR family transcriptional regulator